ncbi:hypothetical protein [Paracoccus sp. MKU1]|uniref:hypothetical protein n=1 Tax=Paracoccus sp. MKU1 TaxID=1745182 RepID=UPI000AD17974|nr:hypothetical protein [Paracoccus sp. MKU1]
MTINQFRSFLYAFARGLGDVQALTSKKPGAVPRRIGRRVAGKLTGRLLRALFK